ncbi:hypothetical protein LAZ67_9000522 [Cordylochernes scorpioides]|uniref:Reverse transcriptase n=1 Tax=Cordylochernes scorpioides TaxID=51811 RepID=A0ABY6KSJ5_9ARAC|nr:hypothetical protein LAZ67_9000522 [Cordylochernes scorpioides]
MKGRRYATLDEIKTASKEELKKIFKNDFLKCFEDWKNRWYKCIISHGVLTVDEYHCQGYGPLNGVCLWQELGCDWALPPESGQPTEEDRCGVCGGDNSTCRVVSGVLNVTKEPLEQYVKVTSLPVGARGLKVVRLDRDTSTLKIPALYDSDQLFYFCQSIIDSFQEKPPKKTTAIFLDMTSDFDRVWREKLREKLHNIGTYSLESRRQNKDNLDRHFGNEEPEDEISLTTCGLVDPPFSENEVKLTAFKFWKRKSPGPERIDNTVVKALVRMHPSLLSRLFNRCLDTGAFPEALKVARVVLLEKSGRGEGKSTTTALNEVLEGVEMGLNKGAWVLFVALDMDGAFNSMSWNKLMRYLMDMGCPDNLCSLVRDFLRDRRISLSFGGRKLQRNCARGCPQGSCCGPILWNIPVNTVFQEELPEGARLVLYADDQFLIIEAASRAKAEKLISQKVDELGENLDTRLSRLEHIRNVKRSATPMSCEVKFNVLPPENPDGFSKPITATNSPRIQCLRGQKTIPGDEDPDKTITTKIITSGDVVSELPESTLEDSPVIQKSEECRQQEMIQTGCVAEEGELIASDNGCGTSVLYKIKRTEGECPQGDIQSENSTPGILSEILHENSNDLGELQCDSVADFSDSVRLSGTTAAIQLDGTELDAPWKCDKARWSKHPEVGAGNPTERDRALDALWKSDDNVCDAEVARNVSAPSSAMQAEKMCQECAPFIFVPSPDKVQIKQPLPRKSSTDLETATGSDTSRKFEKSTALCVVGTKEPRFEGLGKREPLEQENGKPKEEKGGHEMDSVNQVDESTVKIGDLQPRRGRKRRKRNTNDHNPLYIVATECSQGEFKISDGSIVGSEIWPPSCGEPPPCARQRDQSMASALVESGKKARVEMWFCKQGSLNQRYWSCRAVRPLLQEVFVPYEVPLDLQAWLFGVGLHPEAMKLTSVAKATIYKYHLGLEVDGLRQDLSESLEGEPSRQGTSENANRSLNGINPSFARSASNFLALSMRLEGGRQVFVMNGAREAQSSGEFHLGPTVVKYERPPGGQSESMVVPGTVDRDVEVMELGCDWALPPESGQPTEEDRCGVCGGDNSTCRVVSGVLNVTKEPLEQYVKVTSLPVGARGLKVVRLDRESQSLKAAHCVCARSASNFLALSMRLEGGRQVFVMNGAREAQSSGEFHLGPTVVKYERPPGGQSESMVVPGTVDRDVEVMNMIIMNRHLLQQAKVFLERDPHDQYVVSTKVLMAKSKDIRQFLADRDYTTNKPHNWISSAQYLHPSWATSTILEQALLSPLCQFKSLRMEVESSDATGDGSEKRPRISEPPCNLEFNQLKVIHQKVTKKMADVAKSNGMTPEQLQPMLSLVEWALKGTEDIIFDVYKGINHGKENQLPKEKLYTNAVAKPNTTRPTPPPIKQLIKPASKNFAAAYESHVVIKSSNPSTDSREILREIQKADSSILNSPEVAASVNGKGRLVIHTKTTQGASTLAARLQANNNIPKSLNCTERPKIYPRYCLFGVESSTTNDMIVGSLQNNDFIKILPGKRHIKVAHRPKDNPHGYTTVFLEVDDQTANFLEHRVLELFTIAIEQEVDAILLQELPKNFKWPDSSFDTFIPNENNAPSGLVIRSNLNAIPLSSPDSNISTALIRLGNQAVVFASAYWHNSVPDLSFLPTLESAINIGSFSCILGMDANAHSPTWGIGATRDARGSSLEDSASLMGLQFLGSPNYYTWSNGSLRSSIDVTLASSSLAIHATRSCLQEMAFSDHLPILTNFDDIISTEPICSWVETSCLEETFTAFIGSSLHHVTSRLQTAFTPGDIDEVVTLLTTCLQEACNVSMRKKSKSPRPSRPWWNKELSKLRNIVVALRRCYQNTSFYIRSFFKGLYRACHNKLKAAIRREKHLSWITLCQEVSSAAWSSIHRYISKGRRGSLGPPLLKHSDGTPLTPEETCHEVLQHYFPTDWTAPTPSIDWLQSYNQEPAFTVSEVLRAIRRCGRRKSPGPDRLGIRCLLLGGSTLHKTLSQIFTKCLRLGHFPTPWKSGRLVLIPKQNSSSSNQLEKYRPITLLNTLAKVLERCTLARLQWIADYQGWFSPQQFGFLPGRSAEMALDSINNNISEGLQHWRKTLAIGLDISHAFDTVQRHTIIQGLRDLNCPEELIQLSASFLRGRQVIYNAWNATLTSTTLLGVPQGAALSPFYFNIVARKIHLLPRPNNSEIISFADDFTVLIHFLRRFPTREINQFLKQLFHWGKTQGLTFNPRKTQACLFHWKAKRPDYHGIHFQNQPILIDNTIKILGVTFDSKRNFVGHLDNILKRCRWILPRLTSTIQGQFGLTFSAGRKIHNMVILPAILYGSGVWGKRVFDTNGIRKLRGLHYKYAKALIRGGPCTPTIPAISLTGCPPLDISIKSHLAYLEALREGPFESRPSPSSVPYPPLRRPLQFSKSLPERATIVYTDGSRSTNGVGAAVVLPPPYSPLKLKLHNNCTSFQAELLAILYATRSIRIMPRQDFVIASDCQAALHAICHPDIPRTPLTAEIIRNLNTLDNVQLCWVRGHCGIEGNEQADEVAKAAAQSKLPLHFATLPRKYVRSQSKQFALQLWTDLYTTDHATRNLRRVAASPSLLISILPKLKYSDITSTILTGHGFVQADIARTSKNNDPILMESINTHTGFSWLVTSEAWLRPPPDGTTLQPRRLRLLKLWEETSGVLSLDHRAAPTTQLLDLPIIGGFRFLRPPNLLAPSRWVGARVRDLGDDDHHTIVIPHPTRSALADAAALAAFCRRIVAENIQASYRVPSLAEAVVLRGTTKPLAHITTRSARRALDRPRLAALPIHRLLARWTPTVDVPPRVDWTSLRRGALSGHNADVALRLALHALPHPDHPASAGPSCPACGSSDGSLGHRYWGCRTIRPLILEAFNIIGRPPDLQAWIFGTGLEQDDISILSSAKSRVYRHFIQVGLLGSAEDPVIAWHRTLARWGRLPG